MPDVVIIAHANCADGTASALCACDGVKKLQPSSRIDVVFAKYDDNTATTVDVTGKDVYVVDFSFSAPVLRLLAAKANTITVIDHHKTALDELDGAIVPDNVTLRIDMSKSGVGLTWAFFFGDAVMPKLYQYVQDRDLWKFELPQSKEVNAVVSATENTMEAFASLRDSLERPNGVGGAIAAGVAIIAMTKKQAEAHLKRARRAVSTAGVPYMYCNVSSFTSEVGHHILEQVPEVEFVVMYFEDNRTGTRVYSLRSRTGGYKIHQIAKEFGGGGHPHAAGYTTSDDSALRLP